MVEADVVQDENNVAARIAFKNELQKFTKDRSIASLRDSPQQCASFQIDCSEERPPLRPSAPLHRDDGLLSLLGPHACGGRLGDEGRLVLGKENSVRMPPFFPQLTGGESVSGLAGQLRANLGLAAGA